jgi:hypothetical protein
VVVVAERVEVVAVGAVLVAVVGIAVVAAAVVLVAAVVTVEDPLVEDVPPHDTAATMTAAAPLTRHQPELNLALQPWAEACWRNHNRDQRDMKPPPCRPVPNRECSQF